jgi:hypothetical protein
MTEISKNTQVPQCDKTAVKSRFFAQYWGQDYIYKNEYGKFKGNLSDGNSIYHFTNHLNNNNAILLLKPLSKITDEEAKQLPNREYNGFSKPYESAIQFLTIFKLMGFLTSEEADFLRNLGFAIPFMEYSVNDLISFGWVQLL